MEKTMKIEDVLLNAIQTLNGLSLPAVHVDAIMEIARVARNIQAVRDWLLQEEEKQRVADEIAKEPTEDCGDGREDCA